MNYDTRFSCDSSGFLEISFLFYFSSVLPCFVSCFLPSSLLSKAIHQRKIFRDSSHNLLSSQIPWPDRNYSLWLCLNSEELIVKWFIVTSHRLVTLIKQPKLHLVIPNQIRSSQLNNWRGFLSMAYEQFVKNSIKKQKSKPYVKAKAIHLLKL